MGLNGDDHMREFRAAFSKASGSPATGERLRLDSGESLLGTVFGTVTRHDFETSIFPPPAAVAAYARSMSAPQRVPDSEPLIAHVLSILFPNGPSSLPITTHCGILVCT